MKVWSKLQNTEKKTNPYIPLRLHSSYKQLSFALVFNSKYLCPVFVVVFLMFYFKNLVEYSKCRKLKITIPKKLRNYCAEFKNWSEIYFKLKANFTY